MILRTLLIAAAMLTAPQAQAADAARGQRLFTSVGCVFCHGTLGQGDGGPKKLAPDPLPLETFRAFIRSAPQDAPAFNRMPIYPANVLPDADVADIHAYLETIPKPKPAAQIPLLSR